MDRLESDTAIAEPEMAEDSEVAVAEVPIAEALVAEAPGAEVDDRPGPAGSPTDVVDEVSEPVSAAAEPVSEAAEPVSEAAEPVSEAAEPVSEAAEPVAEAEPVALAAEPVPGPPTPDPLADAMAVMERLRARMQAQIIGRDEVIDLVLVALLSDGHVLLEDFPGSGKTTLAKALGSSIIEELVDGDIADFRRIQFTPDLLPSDVTGVSVFDPVANRFHFRHGPIFAHVVLADEINRTSPKVQSAMLEAMAEKQVTVDNQTFPLDELFFVIATQNPLDLAGTYPLPVAQLDRFLFKIRMVHIDRQAELEVLNTHRQRRDTVRPDLPQVTRSQVLAARRAIDENVAIDAQVKECLVDIAQAIREDERVLQGNSTRSLVLMLPALQALAVLRSRDYVAAEDIQTLVPRVFGHRVDLAPGVTELDVVLEEAMAGSIEGLARSTMRRR